MKTLRAMVLEFVVEYPSTLEVESWSWDLHMPDFKKGLLLLILRAAATSMAESGGRCDRILIYL